MSKITLEEMRDFLHVGNDGLCRLDRRAYTDADVFELEIKHIWEKVWVFVAHECQIPNKNDYVTSYIGRQPIIVNRNRDGVIGAFINACSHRGATVCRLKKGNAKLFACPYHGWTFNSSGDLLAPKDEATGAYPPSFEKKDLGLKRVAKLGNYRGLIFASLNPEAESLEQYLGESTKFIDLLIDQGTNGIELVKGVSSYTYNGNWKLQIENGVDGYHASTVHWNFVTTQRNRAQSAAKGEKTSTVSLIPTAPGAAGYFDFGRGHSVIWGKTPDPELRHNYADREEIIQRMGEVRAEWALGKLRNLLIYPNVFLMDNRGSQLRVVRPISVDKTEVTAYEIAPVGERPEVKKRRLRQYEDFFNASGMATPDDLAEFNNVQKGNLGSAARFSDFSRGASHQVPGADRYANEIGVKPDSSGVSMADEGIYVGQYKNWLRMMVAGMEENGGV